MSKAIRTLAILIFAGYVAYVASFKVSEVIATNQGMPSDKVPDSLTMAAWVAPGLAGLLISGLTLALGVVGAIATNRRRQRGWRVFFLVFGILGAPGPSIGGALILGGLLAFGGPQTGVSHFGALIASLGLLVIISPIVLAICALIHERRRPADAIVASDGRRLSRNNTHLSHRLQGRGMSKEARCLMRDASSSVSESWPNVPR